jgi:acyl-CoA synthetase (AMP-forming)/AMP-acid ligase II
MSSGTGWGNQLRFAVVLLHRIADAALRQSPDKTAIRCGSQRLTYAMFVAAADHLAADLVRRGCRRGDRVALWLPNRAEALVAYFACFRAGLIAVALDFRYRPDEVAYCLDRAGATVIVTLGETWRTLVGARSGAHVPEVLCVDENDWLSTILAAPPAGGVRSHPSDADSLSTVFFTSGTTSRPKGVTHTSGRTVSRIDKFIEEASLTPDTVSLVPISLMKPLAFQLLAMAVLRVGGTVVLLRQFAAEAFWRAFLDDPPTSLLALTPNLLAAALAHPLARSASERPRALWLIGGDRMPLALHATFRSVLGYEPVETCGMTETGPYAMNPPFGEKRVGSVGVPPIGVALRLVDAAENDVPPGQVGQVIVRTPDTMVGYWNDTLATFEVLRDGWMRTGDLARADDNGYLWLEGRLRDLIVRDGSNVAPAEIEEVALREPDVRAAAAVGVPDPPHGDAVHLFVVPASEGGDGLETRLGTRLKQSLRAVAVPSAVHLLTDLPLNAAGKVDKNRLRERIAG